MIANKTVFFLLGILLIILGVSMLVPYGVQIFFNEDSHSFLSSALVTVFLGVLFVLANLEKNFRLNLQQTFLFSSLAWFTIASFGIYSIHSRILNK
jgi:trk system potassium uptake protein TrkH